MINPYLRLPGHVVSLTALFVSLTFFAQPAGAQVSVTVESDPAVCGESLSVSVSVSGASDISAFGLVLNYDPAQLSYLSATAGTGTSDWIAVDGNELSLGQVTVGGFRGSGTAVGGSAQIVALTFRCIACPASSALTLTGLVDRLSGAEVTNGTAACV